MFNQTQIIVKHNEVDHVVSYPNVGGFFEIENLKMLLTDGEYGTIARSGHVKGLKLLDMVDAFSNIKVLMPALHLSAEKFFQMSELEALTLVQTYKIYILPFMQKMEKQGSDFLEKVKEANDADTPKG